MKLYSHSILSLLVLIKSCHDVVDARPSQVYRSLIRRDTITDSCSEAEKAAVKNALEEAKKMASLPVCHSTKTHELTGSRQMTCPRERLTLEISSKTALMVFITCQPEMYTQRTQHSTLSLGGFTGAHRKMSIGMDEEKAWVISIPS